VTNVTTEKQEQAALNLYISNIRSPRFATSLVFATRNIVNSKGLIALTDPNSPLLLGDQFWVEASTGLAEGGAANFAVLFGGTQGITQPLNDDLQNQLLYNSVCDFPQEKAYELMPSLRDQPQVFRDCDVLNDGILHRGLFGAIQAFSDDIGPLTTQRYSLGLLDMILGFPIGSQLSLEEALMALVTYQSMNQLFTDYLVHLFQLSSYIYLDYGRTYMSQYENIRFALILIFSFLFVFFYIFAFKRLVRDLSQTAAETNAIMLLLPLQIAKHLKPAQEYIARNLSRD
jgi:hypothetical protein